MAGELPNSFVKRQLGIRPGECPRGRLAAAAQFVADRIDSGIGMLLAVSAIAATPAMTWLLVLLRRPVDPLGLQRPDVPSRAEGPSRLGATMPDTLVARSVLSLDETLHSRFVGGKAAGLSRLLRLGVAVPRGVVIPAATTGRFDDDAIPDDAWCEIVDAWRALAAPVVIVRSSAVGEDSADASFAGQLDSIPDVQRRARSAPRHPEVLAVAGSPIACAPTSGRAATRSAASASSSRNRSTSSMSGVLFTTDPGGSAGALIEYCAGAGEDLVAGRINPGRVLVETSGVVIHDGCRRGPRDVRRDRGGAGGRGAPDRGGVRGAAGHRVDDRPRRTDLVRAGAADYGHVVVSSA